MFEDPLFFPLQSPPASSSYEANDTVQLKVVCVCGIATSGYQNMATYMAGFSQPQHFFAAGCVFADFRGLYTGPYALLLETFLVVS